MPDFSATARRTLAACAVAGVLVLAAGLVLQHAFDMQPCAWCVFQRLVFVVIVLLSALGAVLATGRRTQFVAGLLIDSAALVGAAAALHLHFVASRSADCGITLADKVIMALSLHEWAPWMFFADAPCNKANLPFLGLPFAIWSLLAFAVLGACGAAVMLIAANQERLRRPL